MMINSGTAGTMPGQTGSDGTAGHARSQSIADPLRRTAQREPDAAVVVRDGQAVTGEELIAHCRSGWVRSRSPCT
jgi:hypothetical protein